MLDIPSTTPLGNKIETIGVWVSGGADSALLCYLLAEQIKNQNLPYRILPLTVDYKKPFQGIGVQVVEKIKELLSCQHIFLEHRVYRPTDDESWYGDILAKVFHDKNYENFKAGTIQMLYSAISTNPPVAVQEQFRWGILPEVESKRGQMIEKNKIKYFLSEVDNKQYEFLEHKPFFDIDKKKIAEIYYEKNLTDTLFPLTRSCEKLGTALGHCGECWWCEERKWGFGKL